jgi:hypothetical protein
MFFLLRTAFWLSLIILILPTDGEKQSDVYGTAEAAVQDLSGFCTRNPDACEKGREAFSQFGEKAEFGARMLMDFIASQNAAPQLVPEGAAAGSAFTPAPAPADAPVRREDAVSDTLTGDDLAPGWSLQAKGRSGA